MQKDFVGIRGQLTKLERLDHGLDYMMELPDPPHNEMAKHMGHALETSDQYYQAVDAAKSTFISGKEINLIFLLIVYYNLFKTSTR